MTITHFPTRRDHTRQLADDHGWTFTTPATSRRDEFTRGTDQVAILWRYDDSTASYTRSCASIFINHTRTIGGVCAAEKALRVPRSPVPTADRESVTR